MMLGWFKVRCPINAWEQAWVETRMQQLSDYLSGNYFRNVVVVLPDDGLLPEPWTASRDDTQALLNQLAAHLKVQTPELIWRAADNDEQATPLLLQKPGTVQVSPQQAGDVGLLAEFLFRAVARDILSASELMRPDGSDFLWLADLLAVHCGLEIFLASASASQVEMCQSGGDCCSKPGKPREGLPDRMLGYALALFAWLRRESEPSWRSLLGPDVAIAFGGGVRYLKKTSDSLVDHDSIRQPSGPATPEQLIRQLKQGSPSARVAALWELRSPGVSGDAVDPVVECLRDRSPLIREEAVKTLAYYGAAADVALSELVELLNDMVPAVRAAAALAVAAIKKDPEQVVPELAMLLGDSELTVVRCAAFAVQQFKEDGFAAADDLMRALRGALARCDYALIETLALSLVAVHPDPAGHLKEYFGRDPELLEQATHLLGEVFDSPSAHSVDD